MKQLQLLVLFLLGTSFLWSQDLVYQPKNPSFGGSPLNYNGLIGIAQAQDTFEGEQSGFRNSFERDPLEDFKSSLLRQILSKLSRDVLSDPFSEGLEEGTFQFGDFQLEISPAADGLSISILDIATGGLTEIVIPYF